MSEPRDPVQDALHQLRGEVRDAVNPPPATGLRARAVRQLRVRRATTLAVAAAVVAAVALSGATLLGSTAAPPAPPAGTWSPSPAPSPSSSPEPAPSPAAPPDGPITEVDWRTATIDVPPRESCPEGPVAFVPFSGAGPDGGARGPQDAFPAMVFDAASVAYGDLDGDGNAEAVLEASCAPSEEGLLSGHGGQLLVIAHGEDGALTGLDWVGPPGAAFLSWWVIDGRLLVEADPWMAGPEDHFIPVPGLALAYEWDGDGFTGWEPAEAYPPIVPLDPDQPGPPVRPGPIAGAMRCPDEELRFTRGDYNGGTATAGDATWTIPEIYSQQRLFDLNGTGDRLLITALECERPGESRYGLAVFERAGDGWQGVSAVQMSRSGFETSYWSLAGGELVVDWLGPPEHLGAGDTSLTITYRWDGEAFLPIDE